MKNEDSGAILEEFLSRHGEVERPWLLSDGFVFDGWRVTGRLGRGGSSEVYCVRRVTDGAVAAAKILHRGEETSRKRFCREGDFLSENRNVHFPRLFARGEVEGRPYLVLELLEPLCLPSTDAAVARYLVGVARGLGALHAKGWVHRDVKPRNILCRTGSDEPVLVDLGLLKRMSITGSIERDPLSIVDGRSVGVGTPRFGAPEQFVGGELSPATDVHALGVLAEDCFGGEVPRAWRPIVRRATSSIVRERFQDVREFVSAVSRRHLWRNVLIALGAVVGVAVAFMLFGAYRRSEGKPAEFRGPDASDASGELDDTPYRKNQRYWIDLINKTPAAP